jgi:hypothetical protein
MDPLTLATSHLLSGESSEGGKLGCLSAALEGHCPPLSTFSAWLLRLEVEFIAWSDITQSEKAPRGITSCFSLLVATERVLVFHHKHHHGDLTPPLFFYFFNHIAGPGARG